MRDETKTKGQLLAELFDLRERVCRLEQERVERKQAEESLRDNEVSFADLVAAGFDIVYRMSPDWKQTLYLRGRGFSCETRTPGSVWLAKYVHPEDRPGVLAAVEEAVRAKIILELEHRVQRADGSSGWMFSRAIPLLDPGGGIREWFGTSRDITERKKNEEELRENEAKYRAIVDGFDGFVYVCSSDFRIEYMNGQLIERTGFDATGELCYKTMHNRSDVCPWCVNERVFGGETVRWEVESPKDRRWYYVVNAPLFHSDGTVSKQVMITDVTERKRMEEELRRSEEHFRLTFDQAPVGAAVSGADFRLMQVNAEFCQMLGYSEEELLSLTFCEITHPEDRAKSIAGARRLIVGEAESFVAEQRYIRKDGEIVWGNLSLGSVRNPDNDFLYNIGMIVDITERKRMEEELRELSQRLSYHVDHSPLAVIEWGHDMRLIRWSGEAERMFGWRAAEVIGKRMDDFRWIYEEDRSQVTEVAYELKSGVDPKRFSSNRNYRKDGSVIHCEWYNSSLLDDSGELRSILSLVLDVTEREQMEGALRKSRNELERRVKERTVDLKSANEKLRMVPSLLIEAQENERHRLAGDLHDSIGQTLAAFKFRIEHVITTLEQGEPAQGLDLLNEFVPILQRSLDETRAIYMGLKPTILTEYGILATLEWYRQELLKLYPRQHIELETIIEERDIPERLKVAIFRIAQESLNNAFKHGQPEWVDVRLSLNNEIIELEISDDGVGMDLGFIMESRTAKSLGLIGMRERAELTGGQFRVESTPGGGTTVKASWPICESAKSS